MKTIRFLAIAYTLSFFTVACNNSEPVTDGDEMHEEHDESMPHDEHMDDGHMHDDEMHEEHMHNENMDEDSHMHEDAMSDDARMQAETSIDKQTAEKLTSAYLALKTGLVKGDREMAKGQAQELVKILKNSDDELGQSIGREAESIIAADNIGVQRENFEDLSSNMYHLVSQVDVDRDLYWQYCPMAFDGEGANWISDSKNILNPYFGDKMLKCGSVEKKL